MSPDRAVTLCIPVWQAESFVAETIEAALGQSHEPLRVVLSIDRSSDASADVCRRYEADPRVEVIEQSERLGWVANVNFLLDQVATPYFSVLFHDDRIDPTYLERLVESARLAPAAVCHYTDVINTNRPDVVRVCPSITGSRLQRMLQQLELQTTIPIRGLMSTSSIGEIRLRDYGHQGAGAGVVWLFELLAAGECRRVAEPLYRKARLDGSVTAGLRKREAEEVGRARLEKTRVMIDLAAAALPDEAERRTLVVGCLLHLVSRVRQQEARRGAPLELEESLSALAQESLGVGDLDEIYELPEAAEEALAGLLSRCFLYEGRLAAKEGRSDAAEDRFRRAIEVRPDSVKAHSMLAGLLLQTGRSEWALEPARRALELEPSSTSAYVRLGRALLREGHAEQARAVLRRGLALVSQGDPKHARMKTLLARAGGL